MMKDTEAVYTFDCFRGFGFYPGATKLYDVMNTKKELRGQEDDETYLRIIEEGLQSSFSDFSPDIIYCKKLQIVFFRYPNSFR